MKRGLHWLLLCLCLLSLGVLAGAAVPQNDVRATSVAVAPAPGEFKVLFSACSPGRPAGPGLFIADADFSDPVRISTPMFNQGETDPTLAQGCDSGAWSPDGRRVAVVRNGILHLLELKALAELPDQQPTPLLRAGEPIQAWSPAWSPDGQWIAFHDDNTGLMMVRPDGTGYRVLVPYTSTATWIREAEFSPDGTSLAIRMGGDYPHHLYLVTNLFGPGKPQLKQLTRGRHQESWPHFSPDGTKLMFTRAIREAENNQSGNVWVLDLATGAETQLTQASYELTAQGLGWCPFDNKIYYFVFDAPEKGGVWIHRVGADGQEEVFRSPHLPVGRITWANTGAWIDAVQVLPGETATVKIGVQDADEAIEAIGTIGFDGLTPLTVSLGKSIPQWTLNPPLQQREWLSLHAYANDPRAQNVSGPVSLFHLTLDLPASASEDEWRLLPFPKLYLGNLAGPSYPRLTLSGSVHVIPFAALSLTVNAPSTFSARTRALYLTVSALDREGQLMPGCNSRVGLAMHGQYMAAPLSPNSITLQGGRWSGWVKLPMAPFPGSRVFAYWGDIAGYSPFLMPPPAL